MSAGAPRTLKLTVYREPVEPVDGMLNAGSSGDRGWHAYGMFFKCPQAFSYRFNLRLEPLETKRALIRGTLVHVGLAHFYEIIRRHQEGLDRKAVRPPMEALHAHAHTMRAENTTAADDARNMLEGYVANHRHHAQQLTVVGVEQRLVGEIEGDGAPVRYTQRLDLMVGEGAGVRDGAPGSKLDVWDHKCVPARAVVWTRHGPMPAGSITRGPWDTAAWFDDRALRWAAAMAPVPAGVQPVYRLATKSGRTADYGHTHPVLTRERGMVPLAQVRAGEHVAVALALPDLAEAPLPDAFLTITGALLCDGDARLRYTKLSPEKRARFMECARGLGDAPRERFPQGRVPYIDLPPRGVIETGLDALGYARVRSSEKRVPPALMALSGRQVGVLVGALWSGDGAAYLVVGKDRKPALRIVYASRSRGLCADIRDLLTRLGLVTTLTSSSGAYKGERRGYHAVTVVGRASKRRFLELVEQGVIDAPELAREVPQLRAALEARAERGADPVIEGPIFWDRVESVCFVGHEPTLDVSVPGPATFVVDGIVTHNTTARLTTTFDTQFQMSGQMIGARLLARGVFGRAVRDVYVNAVQVEPYKVARFKIQPAIGSAPGFIGRIHDAAREIERLRRERDPWEWPRVMSDVVCVGRYGACEYMSLCIHGKGMAAQYGRIGE